MTTSKSYRITLPGLVTGVLVVIILYFGKPVLMPLALAALFAFLLSPVVRFLTRFRLPRPLAVTLVTLAVFSFLGLLGWVIGREFTSLASSLPNYKVNIQNRIENVQQQTKGGVMEKLEDLRTTIVESTQQDEKGSSNQGKPAPAPEPQQNGNNSGGFMDGALGTAGEVLGYTATVIVFFMFLLLRQQELRNRMMRLAGFRHVTTVTRTMDETGDRVGRYLLMQALINGLYGLVLAIGLYFIGLPYVVLFGVLAALFRFIPYVGPWLVAVLPCALSLAVFPDWQHPLMVMALVASLELLTNMVLEPVLYGQSVGVSDFALLVAIVFWTWLWGGIGLVLATPLTVCFVVMARHIPSLEWVEILMGEDPKLKPYMVLYQRLLAEDEIEAAEFLHHELKDHTAIEAVDDTVLPAIALAKRERKLGRITEVEEQQLYEAISRLLHQVMPPKVAISDGDKDDGPLLLAWPLDGAADQAALEAFSHLLPAGVRFEMVPSQRLLGEFLAEVETRQPSAILISATPPGSHDTARLQLRRIQHRFPKLRIFIGRWGVPDDVANAAPLLDAGAHGVYTRVAEATPSLSSLLREAAAVPQDRAAAKAGNAQA
jgi:predicted PurR-regulated permease PerM